MRPTAHLPFRQQGQMCRAVPTIWQWGKAAGLAGVFQVETRSHTKMRVSPGAITCPAPRSP